MEKKAEIGIIGGSGLYEPSFFEGGMEEIKIYTPFGPTSDFIRIGEMRGRSIAFLARHGPKHSIPPHKINYRANIWALKKIGVKRIISVSAVGSLRKDYRPGDFVCPDQFIDMTKQRKYSFYEGRMVAHVSMADPFCPELRETIISTANKVGVKMHKEGVYICIEGPRFSTKAESRLWRQWKCDIIGMTLVPEVNLAREAEICYAVIAMITDYDVWAERPVTAEEVVRVMKENIEKAKKLLYEIIPNIPKERKCSCKDALKTALL